MVFVCVEYKKRNPTLQSAPVENDRGESEENWNSSTREGARESDGEDQHDNEENTRYQNMC